jgi:hypothetical protein
MIFRFTTNNSKGVVFAPKIWLNVDPLVAVGISGSTASAMETPSVNYVLTIEPIHHFHPFAFAFRDGLLFKGIFALDKLCLPPFDPMFCAQLVNLLV